MENSKAPVDVPTTPPLLPVDYSRKLLSTPEGRDLATRQIEPAAKQGASGRDSKFHLSRATHRRSDSVFADLVTLASEMRSPLCCRVVEALSLPDPRRAAFGVAGEGWRTFEVPRMNKTARASTVSTRAYSEHAPSHSRLPRAAVCSL